ncbi:putative amidase C869.01 isoform X2 [Chenopodium quinoa]|uniref:putative amidase C869.01 isoform X2 n=1 Tax=Chenopodium quinoa TaxID=63459 RepID=UPI000B794ABB|nr:putative amidase C869.01 isoform X2 [Chenopodium quinoa]
MSTTLSKAENFSHFQIQVLKFPAYSNSTQSLIYLLLIILILEQIYTSTKLAILVKSAMSTSYSLIHFLLIILSIKSAASLNTNFPIKEATIKDLQTAFLQNKITSKGLVEFYLRRIQKLNPILRAVIEVNPDALKQAEEADRRRTKAKKCQSGLDGIPILLKDNIATKDKLNTTAGSYALLGSVVPRDAGVVKRLRQAGAIILGKASLSEWANYRSSSAPSGWCARGGQGQNPYNLSEDPCGSSSGSAIAVAANLAAVSLGTETDGSILCPSSKNSAVGIKPTLGLTSRGGVIPITPTQDTVGTVADAAYVLESIVGYDPYDSEATKNARKYIPHGGYAQFLKLDGLKGKRLGIVRNPFFDLIKEFPILNTTYKQHFHTLRKQGAILVNNLEIPNIEEIMTSNNMAMVMSSEFKLALNSYLKHLIKSPVRSLADVIEFNNKHAQKEKITEYGQDTFLDSEATNGITPKVKKALETLAKWSKDGFEKVMVEHKLDTIVTPDAVFSTVLAIGGYPGISVPAGYDKDGVPFAICFGGLRGSEPKLIEIAYGFEQATKIRKPPKL